MPVLVAHDHNKALLPNASFQWLPLLASTVSPVGHSALRPYYQRVATYLYDVGSQHLQMALQRLRKASAWVHSTSGDLSLPNLALKHHP